ncbi:MAG: hypothetical protein SAK29_28455 [Scytonema sp. PMC 1069.18]|nr:hypothetical protein [Scytonema sp. PMC 1069.18]MEC4887245.1 hypothetical protein [Scytonema sp. PMC 1070.18]
MTQQLTDEEIIKKQERLLKLEQNCSTGRLGKPDEQKQKIDALLAEAKARKHKAKNNGETQCL